MMYRFDSSRLTFFWPMSFPGETTENGDDAGKLEHRPVAQLRVTTSRSFRHGTPSSYGPKGLASPPRSRVRGTVAPQSGLRLVRAAPQTYFELGYGKHSSPSIDHSGDSAYVDTDSRHTRYDLARLATIRTAIASFLLASRFPGT